MSYLDPVALRLARRKAGLTQEALAMRAGIAQPTLVGYEKGMRCPSIETLHALAKALGVPPLSLTSLKDYTDAPNS